MAKNKIEQAKEYINKNIWKRFFKYKIMEVCSQYKVDMICPISQVLKAEQCDCGEWNKRVVTDKDLELLK